MVMNIITNGLLLTPRSRRSPYRPTVRWASRSHSTATGTRTTACGHCVAVRARLTRFSITSARSRIAAAISIGGNFDESSVDSYPALLDFLREQDFADKLAKVAFKPIIREAKPQQPKGFIPLTVVESHGKPLNGTCMTSAGAGVSTATTGACDTCHFLDDKTAFLRDETTKRGFKTVDGVHMGPCEIHKQHAHTIGPGRLALRLPGIRRQCPRVHGPHRRARGRVAERRGAAVRKDHGVGRLQRLRVHPGLRGRLLRRGAHRARRHEQTQLPQA